MYKPIIVFIVLLILESGLVCAQCLNVEIYGIRNNNGFIRLGFMTSEEQLKNEKPQLEISYDKREVRGGELEVKIDSIPFGLYGITLLDDENNNGKLDYGFILPKEGVGFSNYWPSGIRKPKFSNFCFEFNNSFRQKVLIHVRYY
jgi:uncharacterized protein (DUF2141 family)